MPPVTPAASSTGKTVLSIEEIAWLVNNWWTNANPFLEKELHEVKAIAVAVAMAESSGDTRAHLQVKDADVYGLWQINMVGALGTVRRARYGLKSNDELYSPNTNAQVAHDIWARPGGQGSFQPWTQYRNGKYKQFMASARTAVDHPKKPGSVGGGPEQTTRDNPIDDAFSALFDFIKKGTLRIAGFVGGAGLIILAIVLITKKGIKG